MSNISELKFDDKNFNKHTEYGMSLLEKSLSKFGAGRSILIDKNNRIIAGNGIIEAAGNIGLEDLQIVETDGTKIIAVKRPDIDLDTEEGREMAFVDNQTGAVDLSWDEEQLGLYFTEEETKGWGLEIVKDLDINDSDFLQDTEITKDKNKTIECPFCHKEFKL